MNPCRLFLSHEALDAWVGSERAVVDGDALEDKQMGQRFTLREGLRFLTEVTGQPDAHGLIGKVKDMEQLAAIGGEHMADSVIVGDNAYQVQQGFVGVALLATAQVAAREVLPSDPPASMRPAENPKAQKQTIAALQALILGNVK